MQPQSIIWDPAKAALNKRKHDITFEEAATIFRNPLFTEDDQTIRIISARKADPQEKRQYEQHPEQSDGDEMREEYDFKHAVRGKYSKRFPHDVVMVTLAPDVATAFPDAESVNEALRILIKATKRVAPAA